MRKMMLTVLLTLLTVTAGMADIARPNQPSTPTKKPKTVDAELSIKLDRNATEARLIIPKSQIKQLRAQLEDLDSGDDNTAEAGFTRTQTILGGLFMSLAIVFGGFWFAKGGKIDGRSAKAAAIAGIVTASAFTATLVYANAGPPQEARSITGRMFSQAVHIYGFGWGKVKLEASDGNKLELIVPDPQDKPSGEE